MGIQLEAPLNPQYHIVHDVGGVSGGALIGGLWRREAPVCSALYVYILHAHEGVTAITVKYPAIGKTPGVSRHHGAQFKVPYKPSNIEALYWLDGVWGGP